MAILRILLGSRYTMWIWWRCCPLQVSETEPDSAFYHFWLIYGSWTCFKIPTCSQCCCKYHKNIIRRNIVEKAEPVTGSSSHWIVVRSKCQLRGCDRSSIILWSLETWSLIHICNFEQRKRVSAVREASQIHGLWRWQQLCSDDTTLSCGNILRSSA